MSQLKGIKISKSQYPDKVPSTGAKVKLSPFRVGDEKTLMIASESGDGKQMAYALKQVITNCVEGYEVKDMASFDLEYLFLKLRAISVGETSNVTAKCKECEAENKASVDISKVAVDFNKEHDTTVKISSDFGFKMQYPDIEDALDLNLENFDDIITLLCKSVKIVYTADEVITIGKSDLDDLKDLIEELTSEQFKKVQQFFETMPKLKETIKFDCESCKHSNEIVLEGLQSFF